MTVGVPEINLDTWGLRYVKKKSSTEGIDQPKGSDKPYNPKTERTGQSAPTERTGVSAHSSFESGKPSGNIQATNRISDADVKTPDSPKDTSGTQGSDKKRQYTHGKEVPVGSKTGIEVGASEKLTPRGDKQPRDVKNPKGVASGREASHESGIQSIETRTGKNIKGEPVDPEKKTRQPKSGLPDNTQRSPKHENKVPTGSGAPKIKAILDLAIIKCKLLKMKTKKKDYREKGTKDYGSDNSGSAQIPDTGDGKPTSDKQSVKDPPTSPSRYRADESEVTSYGEGASGNQHGGKTTHGEAGDKQLNVEGKIGRSVGHEDIESRSSTKSDEIVEKAIELINEAYGEMNKSNPVIVSDPKGKPFCSNCGRDHGKEDAKALEGTDDQQQRMVSGTRGGNKPSCPSCGHRPAKKGDEYGGEDLENYTDEEIEGMDAKKKDAPSTTSSEGGFNHVYSDVHEKKKQEEAKKGAELVESGFVNPDDPKGKLQKKKPNKVQTDNRVVYD